MNVEPCFQEGLLRLHTLDRALVGWPDWQGLPAMCRSDTVLVVLDLAQTEFVSMQFVLGCIELSRALAEKGRELVLMHMTAPAARMLDAIESGPVPSLLRDEADVAAYLESRQAVSGRLNADHAVTCGEKAVLWS